MSDEQISIGKEAILELAQQAIPKLIKDSLESSYNNPLKEAIDKEIKDNDGVIKVFVKELLTEVLKDDLIKSQIKDQLISNMILKSFQK